MSGPLLEAALAYAASGLPVCPLEVGGKRPFVAKAAGGNGVHDATCDETRIEAWWTRHPDAHIGLACGAAFWALDIDAPDGADTIVALQRRFGRLPATVRQRTGGGW